ncbi:MAG: HAD family hydrolase [Clostridia bacterium]|nr:HAD family hydrolase [Clostridia bacterium]
MAKAKAVVFDMDGTILDTLGDLVASVNYALAQHGFPTHTAKEIRSYLGNGPANLIMQSCPAGTAKETVAAVLATYLPYYAVHSRDTTGPYAGVAEMLSQLKAAGVAMAVVSNKQECDVEALRQVYFADTVSLAVGGSEGRPLKPDPTGVFIALERLGVAKEDAWFVGDSEVDVVTAKNAGMRCVAVSWGFRDAPDLQAAGAEIIVDTPQDVVKYILGE